MFKKLFILISLFFTFISGVQAYDCGDILTVTAIYTLNGYITTPKWANLIANTKAFSQYDAQDNELARFLLRDYNYADKFDNKGDVRYNDFILNGGHRGYIELRDLNDYGKVIALYKIVGDTIYQYDNNPDKKKGFLGALGFYEEGPGHIVTTNKIYDNGSLVRFDASGNKIAALKIIHNKTVEEYNAQDQITGFYKFLSYEQVFPKKKVSASKTASINDYDDAIIPTAILFAQSGKLDNSLWAQELNDIDFVRYFNSSKNGHFSTFGESIYQYNANNAIVGHFSTYGDSIYQYDANDAIIGHFNLSLGDIVQYDKNNAIIGYYSFLGDELYQYDKNRREVGSFSIFGSLINHYDRNGKKIQSFSLF